MEVNGRKILLISHDFSMTGAPIALHYAAKTLKKMGNFVTVLSPWDGGMRQELCSDGIPVMIDSTIYGSDFWMKYAKNFDLIIVNTLIQYSLIIRLNGCAIPVWWWIHEAADYYKKVGKLPAVLEGNIHIVCGGAYAKRVLQKNTSWTSIQELLYCVPDYAGLPIESGQINISLPKDKKIFLSIGTIEKRKGQDLLVQAIEQLQEEDLKRAFFVFVGRSADEQIYKRILALYQKYSENICMIEELEREKLRILYNLCDCIICSSRDDPMPVFMTEGMMLSKILICSENTGTAALLTDGENGFLYHDDNWMELADKLSTVINAGAKVNQMGERARSVYENNFTASVFEKNVKKLVGSLLKESQ